MSRTLIPSASSTSMRVKPSRGFRPPLPRFGGEGWGEGEGGDDGFRTSLPSPPPPNPPPPQTPGGGGRRRLPDEPALPPHPNPLPPQSRGERGLESDARPSCATDHGHMPPGVVVPGSVVLLVPLPSWLLPTYVGSRMIWLMDTSIRL